MTLEGFAPVKAAKGGEPNSWVAKLPATAGGTKPYTVQVTDSASNTATLNDVLFGDVWVCRFV